MDQPIIDYGASMRWMFLTLLLAGCPEAEATAQDPAECAHYCDQLDICVHPGVEPWVECVDECVDWDTPRVDCFIRGCAELTDCRDWGICRVRCNGVRNER